MDNYIRFVNNKDTKFRLELLAEDNNDFQVIKKSFDNTKHWSVGYESVFKIEKIYRVKQNNPKTEDVGGSGFLVFHGTKGRNLPGILEKGFMESTGGRYGRGVYHSNFFAKCSPYAEPSPFFNNNDDARFYFINHIPNKHLSHFFPESDEFPGRPSKTISYCKKVVMEPRQMEEYKCDSNGSFINVAADVVTNLPEYLASSNIVTPKYLVHAKKCRLVKSLKTTIYLLNKA